MYYRDCTRDDEKDGEVSGLLYASGPEIYDYLYKSGGKSALAFIHYEYLSGIGFCGYKALRLAKESEQSGRVVAVCCVYDREQYNRLVWGTLLNVFRFYGLIRVWAVLFRLMRISSVMSAPQKGEVYFSNGALLPEYRSKGIGGGGLDIAIEEARQQGYRRIILDVDVTNPLAEKFYSYHGFTVCDYKKFTGKDPRVPDARVMELVL